MDFEKFKKEMARTGALAKMERKNYWKGYQRGLRRIFYGEKFGTPEEHKKLINAVNSLDKDRRETGKGYADALRDWNSKEI